MTKVSGFTEDGWTIVEYESAGVAVLKTNRRCASGAYIMSQDKRIYATLLGLKDFGTGKTRLMVPSFSLDD
jgi:hypothetical protein